MKMGSESIEAIIRSRCILFAGFMAHMEDTRSLKCVVFGARASWGGSETSGRDVSWMTLELSMSTPISEQ